MSMAVLNIDPTLATLIGAVLVLLGLALAFWGRSIMRTIMAMIGAALGSILGFLVGYAVGGYFIGLILAMVFGFIGSVLFGKLVKIGLALVMGLLAAGLIFIAFGIPQVTGLGDTRVVGAIVALFVVFAISYYFIEEILGIITAIIGGILLGLGMYLLLGPGSGYIAGGAAVAVFLAGAVSQSVKIRRQKRTAAATAAPAAYPYPPPPPPPPPP